MAKTKSRADLHAGHAYSSCDRKLYLFENNLKPQENQGLQREGFCVERFRKFPSQMKETIGTPLRPMVPAQAGRRTSISFDVRRLSCAKGLWGSASLGVATQADRPERHNPAQEI